jgi:hypothetical protein
VARPSARRRVGEPEHTPPSAGDHAPAPSAAACSFPFRAIGRSRRPVAGRTVARPTGETLPTGRRADLRHAAPSDLHTGIDEERSSSGAYASSPHPNANRQQKFPPTYVDRLGADRSALQHRWVNTIPEPRADPGDHSPRSVMIVSDSFAAWRGATSAARAHGGSLHSGPFRFRRAEASSARREPRARPCANAASRQSAQKRRLDLRGRWLHAERQVLGGIEWGIGSKCHRERGWIRYLHATSSPTRGASSTRLSSSQRVSGRLIRQGHAGIGRVSRGHHGSHGVPPEPTTRGGTFPGTDTAPRGGTPRLPLAAIVANRRRARPCPRTAS